MHLTAVLVATALAIATLGLTDGKCIKNLADNILVFDDSSGYGRTFDGIGGISGGGATSKLLVSYPKQIRSEILDFLFLPNFGASLQILKVEIGGDIQSTDGTEASHMHTSWEENYDRGYEWWLMKEAKRRNPDIKLYGLPWGFPGWIRQGQWTPYANITILADYVVRWVNGAKIQHNLTIDYIGIWNERDYNVDYIKTLRKVLDQWGFSNVLIVANDNGWDIAHDIKSDADLAKDVYAIGAHYPGTGSSGDAQSSGSVLWASEDYSTFNDEVGAGCWARILNQNYVNGLMTATISWDLIASYYEGLPYFRDGLMTAVEPWSGNYVVQSPIWISAHTTQFSSIGWKYLNHNSGVGFLPGGGSFVGLVSPDKRDLTIVIETMTHDHSVCIRPWLAPYNVSPQNVTITLNGTFAKIPVLYVWFSQLQFGEGESSNMFINQGPVKVVDGKVTLSLGLDQIFTLTTLNVGLKGSYPPPPPSSPFPLPYKDNFERYNLHEEPKFLAQQTGSFEVLRTGSNQFIRQMVLETPLAWCDAEKLDRAVSVIGNSTWENIFIEVDFYIPEVNGTDGVFIAARIDKTGCDLHLASGIYFFVTSDFKYYLSYDPSRSNVLTSGVVPSGTGWHKISLLVQEMRAAGAYDGRGLFSLDISLAAGFAGLGTDNWGLADFDNLYIASQQQGVARMKEYFRKPISQPLHFIKENH